MNNDEVKKRKRQARIWRIAAGLWAVIIGYWLLYVYLSMCGSYSNYLAPSGKAYDYMGFAVPDSQQWVPKCVVKRPGLRNTLGFLYGPYIDLDRRFWHHDKVIAVDARLQNSK